MDGCALLCVIVYECVWLCVGVCGCVGCVWVCVVVCDCVL